MAEYTVIYDSIAWATGKSDDRLRYHTAARGETVTDAQLSEDFFAGKDKAKELMDKETHPPFGAIAPVDSKAAAVLSTPVVGAEDPVQTQARLRRMILGESGLTDPEGLPSDEAKTAPSPDVARLRAGEDLGPQGRSGEGSGASLSDMNKADLQSMARGLDLPDEGTVSELRERIRAHVAAEGGQPAAPPPPSA